MSTFPNDQTGIGSFREEPGIYPGWHMNKAHWLSVALDGSVEDEKITFLVTGFSLLQVCRLVFNDSCF